MAKVGKQIIGIVQFLQEAKRKPFIPSDKVFKELIAYIGGIEKESRQVQGRHTFIIEFGTETKKQKVDLLDDSTFIFEQFFQILKPPFCRKALNSFLLESIKFYTSPGVSLKSKISLLDMDGQNLNGELKRLCFDSPCFYDAMIARIDLGRVALSNLTEGFIGDERQVCNAISSYLSILVSWSVRNGQFIQLREFFNSELGSTTSDIFKGDIVYRYICLALAYNLDSAYSLTELLDNYEHLLDEDKLSHLRSKFKSNSNGTLHGFKMRHGSLSNKILAGKKGVATLLRFSIPNTSVQQKVELCELNNEVNIYFCPVLNFWKDPIFQAFSDWELMDMHWRYYCDIKPENEASYTHVIITIDNLFLPDLTISEETYDSVSFEDEEALSGRSHYPHKEYIVRLLRDYFTEISEFIKIKKEQINVNLFSNFLVQLIDTESDEWFFQSIYAATNPDSFLVAQSSFQERLLSANLQDCYLPIVELFRPNNIISEKNLHEFVCKTIELLVKDSIEQHGSYKYLWAGLVDGAMKPRSESDIQPFIYTQLKLFYEYMGIEISREKVSANGSVDFHVAYKNKRGVLLRLCVELKLAHSSKIEDGLNMQLPAYMKSERCKYGIYLVFWFKGKNFNRPSKFKNPQDLKAELHKINRNSNILTILVNCDKPISPSQLTSNGLKNV